MCAAELAPWVAHHEKAVEWLMMRVPSIDRSTAESVVRVLLTTAWAVPLEDRP